MSFPGMPAPSIPNIYKPVLLPDFIFGLILVLIAVFADKIADEYSTFIYSDVGTLILFGGVLAILYMKGPVLGILSGMAALMLYNSASASGGEQFTDYQYRKYHNKHRWFVEEVLGERPKAVETDRVQTISVQS